MKPPPTAADKDSPHVLQATYPDGCLRIPRHPRTVDEANGLPISGLAALTRQYHRKHIIKFWGTR
jgi:hypothetical protein